MCGYILADKNKQMSSSETRRFLMPQKMNLTTSIDCEEPVEI